MVQPVHRTIAVHSGVNLVRIWAVTTFQQFLVAGPRACRVCMDGNAAVKAAMELARILLKKL